MHWPVERDRCSRCGAFPRAKIVPGPAFRYLNLTCACGQTWQKVMSTLDYLQVRVFARQAKAELARRRS